MTLTAPDTDDDLPPRVDPLRCDDCVALGDHCEFHAGLAEGWDQALAAVVAVLASADPDLFHLNPQDVTL